MKSGYAYATGKIRVLETKILDATDIERMVDAPNLESAFKVLYDTDYADNLLEVNPADYRLALADDYRQLYQLMQKLVPNRKYLTLLFLDRDLVNLKLLFKEKLFSADIKGLIKENGMYDANDLKFYLNDVNQAQFKITELDSNIRRLIDQAKANLNSSSSPSEVDTELTRGYFSMMTDLAKSLRNNFIKKYVRTIINNTNLLTTLRSQRLQLPPGTLQNRLFPGGDLKPKQLIFVASLSQPKFFYDLLKNQYGLRVAEAFDRYTQTQELYPLEKELEDYKTRFLALSKYIAHGPEIILTYCQAKKVAVNNIRIILTGKMNNINSQEIRKTLRATV